MCDCVIPQELKIIREGDKHTSKALYDNFKFKAELLQKKNNKCVFII